MTAAVLIDPNAVLDDGALLMQLGITSATLARARKAGKLRFSRQGKRVLYLGCWVLDWLRADATPGGAADAN
jgi:hypothetical protein